MYRTQVVAAALALAIGLGGCAWFQKKTITSEEPAGPETAEMKEIAPEAPQPGRGEAATERVTPDEPAQGAAGSRTHVVQPGDTLSKLARQYYNGDQKSWKRIWEANRDKIPNPDKLTVGTQLVIP